MVAIQGFGGGLDVTAIVNAAMSAERVPITQLQAKEQRINTQADAYRDLKAKLLSLSSAAQSLGSSATAAAKTAVSSDITVLTATGKSAAVAGSYSITVGQLATTDTFASVGLASDTALLTGSFDLKVGSNTAKTITIDASNNTLAGLRDSINNSGAGVSATVVKDGSNYKLAIISKDSGTANAITLSNFSSGALQTQLGMARKVTLQDATLTVNGIDVTSSSNTVTDALQGVTLNLVKTGSSKVTVSPNSEVISNAVNEFIKAYNALNSFFTAQFKYDAAKGTAGVLAGNGTVRGIQSQLQQAVSSSLSGLSTPLTNLREAGIDLANDGSLSLDSTKLQEALDENPTAVANLFQTTARFSDSRASLVATGSKTQSGTYNIFVTAAGANVAGTINGHAASGSGHTLLASYQGGSEDGLAIALNVTDVGSVGTVTVTVGIAELMQRVAAEATRSSTGSIDAAISGIDDQTRDIVDTISAMDERLAKKQLLLTEQLIRADTALKNMQTQLASLSSQLASLS
jgi:flagellar hook-associated protein 2